MPLRADPVLQPLRSGGFRVGVVGGSQYGDEELGFTDFTCVLIDDRCRMTGVIYKQLFPAC